MSKMQKITPKPKLIDINNSICPIVIDKINQNEYYMSCDICKNNFSFDAINEWFKTKSYNSICPMCRSEWSNKNIYINSDDINQKIEQTLNLNICLKTKCSSDANHHENNGIQLFNFNLNPEDYEPSGNFNIPRANNVNFNISRANNVNFNFSRMDDSGPLILILNDNNAVLTTTNQN